MDNDYGMITLKAYLDKYESEDEKKVEASLVLYQKSGRSERNAQLLKALLD